MPISKMEFRVFVGLVDLAFVAFGLGIVAFVAFAFVAFVEEQLRMVVASLGIERVGMGSIEGVLVAFAWQQIGVQGLGTLGILGCVQGH
jgi:hypothetical protein